MTRLEQDLRNNRAVEAPDLDEFLSGVGDLARKHHVGYEEVIAAKRALELQRRNDLYVANGVAFDAQMAGIGELLRELCAAVAGLKGSKRGGT